MKNKLSLLPAVLILQFFFLSNTVFSNSIEPKTTEDTDEAIEYNDNMIAIQIEVDNCLVYLLDAIETGKSSLSGALKECSISLKQAKKDVKKIGEFKEDSEYQEKMLDLIAMYEDLIKTEIQGIIDISLKEGEFTDEDFDAYNNYYEKALSKYDAAFETFFESQYKFADKWGFTIEGTSKLA